jgi:hypothetical protein
MNSLKNILGPLGTVAAAIGVATTVAGSAMSASLIAFCLMFLTLSCSVLFHHEHMTSYHTCRYDVDGGQRAVLFQKFAILNPAGVQDVVKAEGTHFLVPWFQQAIMSVAFAFHLFVLLCAQIYVCFLPPPTYFLLLF